MSKKLTPWFPPGVKPVRKGVYVATVVLDEPWLYRYWNGREWLTGGDSVGEAVIEAKLGIPTSLQQYIHWRGLAEQPK